MYDYKTPGDLIVTDKFQEAVSKLKNTKDLDVFLERFGTHYISGFFIGGIAVQEIFTNPKSPPHLEAWAFGGNQSLITPPLTEEKRKKWENSIPMNARIIAAMTMKPMSDLIENVQTKNLVFNAIVHKTHMDALNNLKAINRALDRHRKLPKNITESFHKALADNMKKLDKHISNKNLSRLPVNELFEESVKLSNRYENLKGKCFWYPKKRMLMRFFYDSLFDTFEKSKSVN